MGAYEDVDYSVRKKGGSSYGYAPGRIEMPTKSTQNPCKVITLPLGSYAANCYIVYKDDVAMVVDPGSEAERILSCLEEYQLRCELIVITHRHHDHVGAAADLAYYTKAPIAVGFYDAKAAMDPHQTLAIRSGMSLKEARKKTLPHPDKELIEGDKIMVGGMQFRVLETPGHTVGGICLLGEDMLFSGDTLFKGTMGRTDFETGDEFAMMKSLYRLGQLPPQIMVYPGHGDSTTIGDELQQNQFMMYACSHREFAEGRNIE